MLTPIGLNKMKLLICLDIIPYNLQHGFNLRVFNLIKELRNNNDIYVIVNQHIEREIEWFNREIDNIILFTRNDIKNIYKEISSSYSLSLIDKRMLRYSGYDPEFHNIIKKLLRIFHLKVL